MKRKEYDYVITLEQPDYKLYNIFSILMCLMAVVVTGLGFLYAFYSFSGWIQLALSIFVLASLINSFRYWNRKDYIITYKWALFSSALLWFIPPIENFWIGSLYLIIVLLERQVKFPREIGFDDEGVTINTFPFKFFPWNEIVNAILKDNLLTIDFVNNRILQKEAQSDVPGELEKEFNEFCAAHLPFKK